MIIITFFFISFYLLLISVIGFGFLFQNICFGAIKDLEDQKIIDGLQYCIGVKYFLRGCKQFQKDIEKFINKFKLPFTLLADESKEIVTKYGVWGPKQFMGRTFDGIHRITFLIDPKGTILKIWPKVKPEPHPAEVLECIRDADGD